MEKKNELNSNDMVAEKPACMLCYTKPEHLKDLWQEILSEEILRNADDLEIGVIESINILDKKTQDGNAFQQFEYTVQAKDGKRYKKRYSIDFIRKYLIQIGRKANDTIGAVVVFRPQPKFKSIGWFAFIDEIMEEDGRFHEIVSYIDYDSDIADKLKKLGL